MRQSYTPNEQPTPTEAAKNLIAAFEVVLDQIDYTTGACRLTEMVGACLEPRLIDMARARIATMRTALSLIP